MTYVLLDDKFHSNPKVAEAGNDGAGLYARALSYCGDHLTDGFVPEAWAKGIATARLSGKLIKVGLWRSVKKGDTITVDDTKDGGTITITIPAPGFYILDFLQHNQSSAPIKERRAEISRKRSEAGKRGAAARWQTDGFANSKRMANAMANAWQTDGPNPNPNLKAPAETFERNNQDEELPHEWLKLLETLTDADPNTGETIRQLNTKHRFAQMDFIRAREAATGPGVKSPTKVAVAELIKCAQERDL